MPNVKPATLTTCKTALTRADRVMATLTYSSTSLYQAFTEMYQALQDVLIDAKRVTLPACNNQQSLLD